VSDAVTDRGGSSSYDEVLYFTPQEINSIISLCKHMRDSVLVRTLYDLGCTVSEIVAIKVKEIDFDDMCIKVNTEDSVRIAYFSEQLKEMLGRFLNIEKKVNDSESYVFGTARGQLTTKRVQQIIKECTTNAGFKSRTKPQILRYSHIVNAHLHHVPLPAILAQTGIKRSRAIQILAALKDDDVNNLLHYRRFFEGYNS
jgi:site-specific recombinase XerD